MDNNISPTKILQEKFNINRENTSFKEYIKMYYLIYYYLKKNKKTLENISSKELENVLKYGNNHRGKGKKVKGLQITNERILVNFD